MAIRVVKILQILVMMDQLWWIILTSLKFDLLCQSKFKLSDQLYDTFTVRWQDCGLLVSFLHSSSQSSFFSSSPFSSSTEPISSISSSSSSVPLSTSFARASCEQKTGGDQNNVLMIGVLKMWLEVHSHCKLPQSLAQSFPVREPGISFIWFTPLYEMWA